MVSKALFSSAKDDWGTPQAFFEFIEKQNPLFPFIYDLAASKENTKAPTYFTKEDDFLSQDCERCYGRAFLNPPYSKNLAFLRHARKVSSKVFAITCLIPARTDTDFWFNEIRYASSIFFIKGRLRFEGAKHPAPFPSIVCEFSGRTSGKPDFHFLTPTPKERGF